VGVQLAPDHVPPDWPDGSPQQIHLDLWVDDIDADHKEVMSLGATLLQAAEDSDRRGCRKTRTRQACRPAPRSLRLQGRFEHTGPDSVPLVALRSAPRAHRADPGLHAWSATAYCWRRDWRCHAVHWSAFALALLAAWTSRSRPASAAHHSRASVVPARSLARPTRKRIVMALSGEPTTTPSAPPAGRTPRYATTLPTDVPSRRQGPVATPAGTPQQPCRRGAPETPRGYQAASRVGPGPYWRLPAGGSTWDRGDG
jgi:hypothetical protein